MPTQAPVFGARAPRKAWARAEGQPDLRLRGRAGQRARAQVLAEEPLCRHCLAQGRSVPATRVDHIIALSEGGSDARSNKQGLCEPHHDAKSKAERAGARADRTG